MTITRAFFVREIVRLRRAIAQLQHGLNGYEPDDSRTAGQRRMLANEYKCREMLLDLAESAVDLPSLEMECRVQYALAKQRHDRRRDRLNGRRPMQDDEWWESLGRMQYLCHLLRSLDNLKHEYTPEEIREEIHKVGRTKDVPAAAERSEILGAMARAESSAAGKSFLTRDDVEQYRNGTGLDDT